MRQIAHPQPAARGLISVGGADALAGGADPVFAQLLFLAAVQLFVQRQHQACPAVDEQPSRKIYALRHQALHLLAQAKGIDHRALGYNATRGGIQHTGGNGMEDILFAFRYDGVPGVRPSLEAHHHIRGSSQKVHDLRFRFIAPHTSQNC